MRHRVRVRLALLLFLMLSATGCVASLEEMERLEGRLVDAGYTDVDVGHSVTTGGHDTVLIRANNPSATDAVEIGRLVWNTYVEDVDEVVITLNGVDMTGTKEEMQALFGSRAMTNDPNEETELGEILLVSFGVIAGIVLVAKVLSAIFGRS